jgi:hypothetical protein
MLGTSAMVLLGWPLDSLLQQIRQADVFRSRRRVRPQQAGAVFATFKHSGDRISGSDNRPNQRMPKFGEPVNVSVRMYVRACTTRRRAKAR